MPKEITFTDETNQAKRGNKSIEQKKTILKIIKSYGFEVAYSERPSYLCSICKETQARQYIHTLIKPQIVARLKLSPANVIIDIFGQGQITTIRAIAVEIRDALDMRIDLVLKSNDDRMSTLDLKCIKVNL